MKKAIIIEHNGGRLANQLWNYASVYAYCLEKGYICKNPSFFLYVDLFEGMERNAFAYVYRYIPNRKVVSLAYKVIARIQTLVHKTVFAKDEFLLPPSINKNKLQVEELEKVELKKNIYLSGWLFRNPDGLDKYHSEITNLFKPKKLFADEAESIIKNIKEKFDFCIGVHIRQGDYRTWHDGKFYVSPKEAMKQMKTFVDKSNQYSQSNTVFIICSDEKINKEVFADLNVIFGPNNVIGDLYILSLTDHIIGSNSTFGSWASYIGKVNFTRL